MCSSLKLEFIHDQIRTKSGLENMKQYLQQVLEIWASAMLVFIFVDDSIKNT